MDERVSNDLIRVFNAKLDVPKKGLIIGLAVNVLAHLFNYPYSFRLMFLLAPAGGELFMHRINNKPYFRTLNFLDWVIQYRKSRAILETSGEVMFKTNQKVFDDYLKIAESKRPINDIYQEICSQVIKECELK